MKEVVCLPLFLLACNQSVEVAPEDLARPTTDLAEVAQAVTGCVLGGIWGSSGSDVYVGGSDCASHGVILHSTGDGTWTRQTLQAAVTGGIWGSGSGDVYAVALETQTSGEILHSTGNGTWTPQATGGAALSRVWGSGPGDVYAVGENGAILHSTGDGVWTPQTSGTTLGLLGIWGSSPSDIYAVGGEVADLKDGVILHSTGNGTWQLQSLPPKPPLGPSFDFGTAVWGSGSNDVYAVFVDSMGAGRILHSAGDGTWTSEYTASYQVGLWAVWGSNSGDVYVAGDDIILHSTGNGSWTPETAPKESFEDLWGSADGVYAVAPTKIVFLPAH